MCLSRILHKRSCFVLDINTIHSPQSLTHMEELLAKLQALKEAVSLGKDSL